MKKSIGAQTLAYPNPVWCVGAYDDQGKPNVMTIAWGGICNSKPVQITVSLRAATYTHGCIMARKAFTVSVPSRKYVAEADYYGMVSGRNTDKFTDTGLTPVRSDVVDAPFVGEFPLILECRLAHVHELGLHTQFIGEVADIKVDEEALNDKGLPTMGVVDPLVFGGGIREYWSLDAMIGSAFDIGKKFKA